jgi:hypothetical protein
VTALRVGPYRGLLSFAFIVCTGVASASAAPAQDNIAGAMTADYLLGCQKNQDACMAFTNRVLEILTTAAHFQQTQIYKGCAPVPLDIELTGRLVNWILAFPQQATGYAADDIAKAAEALWPCK